MWKMERKTRSRPKTSAKEDAVRSSTSKKFTKLLEKRSTKKREKEDPDEEELAVTSSRDEKLIKSNKKQKAEKESGLSSSSKEMSSAAESVPVSLSAEGRDQISGGSGQSSAATKDYIRNTISLPQMNNSAEELLIDGFALVSFLTKEDLDTFITEKEGKGCADRLKQQLHHRQQQSHGLRHREMGEEKSGKGPRRSLSASREKRAKTKKMASQQTKDTKDLSPEEETEKPGTTNTETPLEGIKPEDNINFPDESTATMVHKTLEPNSVTDKLDRQTAADTLSMLPSGLKQELLARLTPTSVKQETQSETDVTDGGNENSTTITNDVRQDNAELDNGLKTEEEGDVKVAPTQRKPSIHKLGQNDDGADSKLSEAVGLTTTITKRESSASPNSSRAEAVLTPSSSHDPNRIVADSSQKTNSSTEIISINNSTATPVTSGCPSGVEPVAERSSSEHRHKDKKSHRDRERDKSDRDRDRDRHRDKEKDREKDKERDKSTPRPDSRLSVASKADNHNPAAQRGFNPVIQSPNPLTQHLFHSSPTPLSPPFPSSHHSAGSAAANLFPHLNFQQPRWGMFSPAMMGPGAGGMPGGMPMGLMGPGFDRPGGFFGFPPFTNPGGSSFSGAGMGNGMGAAHSLLSSTMSSPFPPSMSGMNGVPNFPGMNGLPPNFQSPQTSSASSASQSNNSSGPKKPGKWCAMHVRIAWEIYHHQQRQVQQNANTAEAMKLGDFSKDLSLLAKMGPPLSLNLTAPGLTPSFFSRPGAPSDLVSSLMPGSAPRLPAQPSMSWPMRPPYNFGMPSPSGLGGLSFPGNPMMSSRDMLNNSTFSPDAWRRPMAFGGLANPSPNLGQVNGSSSSSQSTSDRKEPVPEKKPALSPVESREKRPVDDSADRDSSSSSSKKRRSESSHHRSSKSPNVHGEKRHSPKESRQSPERERERERKRMETPPRESKKSTGEALPAGSVNNSKPVDLRNRSESASASMPPAPERTKSALSGSTNQSGSLLSGPSPLPPSFPGESPFPSFLSSQLSASNFDRNSSSMFPSAPGFPPMWPNFDPLRQPGMGSDPMAAQLYQWQRMRAGGGLPMGLHPDMFRANPFMPQINQDRLNEMMRMKTGGFSPGPPGPGSLFSPQLSSFMRGDSSSMYSPPSFDTMRRSPTPAKSTDSRKDSSGVGATQNGGKDSPTDLSKSRSSAAHVQSQSGKDSTSSSSSSSATKSSKGQLERSHHRHSPNGETSAKVDKEKS